MFGSADAYSSFVDILVPVCLEKPVDLMGLLELLEINDLPWIKVILQPLSWQRGCMFKEKRNLFASWQTARYVAAAARILRISVGDKHV